MAISLRPSREIDGKGYTVRERIDGRKCSMDCYQRGYELSQQVAELLDEEAVA